MNPTPGRPPLRLASLHAVLALIPLLLGFVIWRPQVGVWDVRDLG